MLMTILETAGEPLVPTVVYAALAWVVMIGALASVLAMGAGRPHSK
ncbi:MAG: hypothetical protein ACK5KO_06750 [Arachnia sp.]